MNLQQLTERKAQLVAILADLEPFEDRYKEHYPDVVRHVMENAYARLEEVNTQIQKLQPCEV